MSDKLGDERFVAFQKQFNDMIGKAIVDGLLDPSRAPGLVTGIHAKGRDYLQDGGDYSQATGGDHEQTGGGSYTQSIPTKAV